MDADCPSSALGRREGKIVGVEEEKVPRGP